MRTRLVEPQKLHKDLDSFYLSKYLINELREFYTIKEQDSFFNSRTSDLKARMPCKQKWPICYLGLEQCKVRSEPHSLMLSSHFVMSNFKHNHFIKDKSSPQRAEPLESYVEKINSQKLHEEDILMERQHHTCEYFDKEFEKMKSEVRIRISKQVANLEANGKLYLEKKDSQEANQVYDNFIKKRRDTNLSSQPEMSDYSHSMGSKPSHDIDHYHNTRRPP